MWEKTNKKTKYIPPVVFNADKNTKSSCFSDKQVHGTVCSLVIIKLSKSFAKFKYFKVIVDENQLLSSHSYPIRLWLKFEAQIKI